MGTKNTAPRHGGDRRCGTRFAARAAAPTGHALSAAALAATSLVAAARCHGQAQSFTFDSDTAGWSVFNIHYLGEPLGNPTPLFAVPHDGGNGLPPGSARVGDATGETWIGATTAVQGDKSSLYGVASVSYDVYYRFADPVPYAAVALLGGGLTLYQAMPSPPLNQWLHWDFPLVEGEWRVGSISGAAATSEQIVQVLGDFKGLFIHTEWKSGPDDTNVDNVSIGSCAGGACCPADLDGDSAVGPTDLGILLGGWGTRIADLDGDLDTSASDLAILLGAWGPC